MLTLRLNTWACLFTMVCVGIFCYMFVILVTLLNDLLIFIFDNVLRIDSDFIFISTKIFSLGLIFKYFIFPIFQNLYVFNQIRYYCSSLLIDRYCRLFIKYLRFSLKLFLFILIIYFIFSLILSIGKTWSWQLLKLAITLGALRILASSLEPFERFRDRLWDHYRLGDMPERYVIGDDISEAPDRHLSDADKLFLWILICLALLFTCLFTHHSIFVNGLTVLTILSVFLRSFILFTLYSFIFIVLFPEFRWWQNRIEYIVNLIRWILTITTVYFLISISILFIFAR